MEKSMDKIVALAKARGFVYPGSEIYGGLANTWDYGNLGVELKNNVKKAWWQKFIQESPYNVGVDCAILMNPQTWVASGHLGGFSDPLMDCKECHERFRADKLIEDYMQDNNVSIEGSVDGWSQDEMKQFIEEHNICCPSCGKKNWTDIRQFNLMFKTFQGVTEDAKNTVYLRPETAQGIFVNFKNVQRTSRKKAVIWNCKVSQQYLRTVIVISSARKDVIPFDEIQYYLYSVTAAIHDITENIQRIIGSHIQAFKKFYILVIASVQV